MYFKTAQTILKNRPNEFSKRFRKIRLSGFITFKIVQTDF